MKTVVSDYGDEKKTPIIHPSRVDHAVNILIKQILFNTFFARTHVFEGRMCMNCESARGRVAKRKGAGLGGCWGRGQGSLDSD